MRRRLVEGEQMIPAEQVVVLVSALADVVGRHVTDPDTAAAIFREIAAIARGDGGDGPR